MKKAISVLLLVVLLTLGVNASADPSPIWSSTKEFSLQLDDYKKISIATNRMDIFIRFHEENVDTINCIIEGEPTNIVVNLLSDELLNIAVDAYKETVTTGTLEIWLPCSQLDYLLVISGSGNIYFEDPGAELLKEVFLETIRGGHILFEPFEKWEHYGNIWTR